MLVLSTDTPTLRLFVKTVATGVPKTGISSGQAYFINASGSAVACTNTMVEVDATHAKGWYTVLVDAADSLAAGPWTLSYQTPTTAADVGSTDFTVDAPVDVEMIHASADGAANLFYGVTNSWPSDAGYLYFANFPSADAGGSGGLVTTNLLPTNFSSMGISAGGTVQADVYSILGNGTAPNGLLGLHRDTNTAQSGGDNYIGLNAAHPSSQFNGSLIVITSGTGTGQVRSIIAAPGGGDNRATVSPNWTTNPDNTSGYVIIAGATALAGNVQSQIKQNTALASFGFVMLKTDGTAATGKTVTITRAIDNGAFGAGTLSAVTEISNGWYRVDFAAADLNGKTIKVRATATGCRETNLQLITTP